MELKDNQEKIKYQMEEIDINEQDSIKLIKLFVKTRLKEHSQENFYTHLKNKESTIKNVKEALSQAILTETAVEVLKLSLEKYENGSEEYKKETKEQIEYHFHGL